MKLPLTLTPGFLKALPPEEREKLGWGGISRELAIKRWEVGQERELQGLVRNWLTIHEFPVYGGRMDKRTRRVVGEPDFLTTVKGRFLAIECKAKNGELSEKQAEQCRLITLNHGAFCLAYSLEDVRRIIKELSS
jgi:hypothetical protein